MNDLATTDTDQQDDAISFAVRFVSSEAFRSLFREGMTLVEETAAYLDGDGRHQSRELTRLGALAYATESMRLTTRLMQLASWLLVQRAVAEGELSPDQARADRHKVRLATQDAVTAPETFDLLPERLRDLVAQSLRLQERVRHLDGLMNGGPALPQIISNPIASQLDLLRSAFPQKQPETV